MLSNPLDILLAVGAAAGALASIYKAYRPIWGALVKIKDRMFATRRLESQVLALTDVVTRLSQQCQGISAQLQNNGGSSVKDSLDRIEARQHLFEQRQRVLFADATTGIAETDAEGRCLWVNRKMCEMTGRLPEDLMGYGWRNSIAPDERERFTRDWDQALDEHREFERYYHIQTPAGRRIRVYARTQKLLDSKGRVAGWMKHVEQVAVTTPDYQVELK
jgi:PAS domain S-box-containing protein